MAVVDGGFGEESKEWMTVQILHRGFSVQSTARVPRLAHGPGFQLLLTESDSINIRTKRCTRRLLPMLAYFALK